MSQSNLFEDKKLESLGLPRADVQLWKAWLDQEKAEAIFDALIKETQWEQPDIRIAGRTLKIPRLQSWHGDADAVYEYSAQVFHPQAWTSPLLELKQKLLDDCGLNFNSVLVNLYRDGNDSVSWHADDERELGEAPSIASISLGATRKFSLKPVYVDAPTRKSQSIDLHSGDLLLMQGDTQKNWHHAVPKTSRPCSARINLTFRTVIKA